MRLGYGGLLMVKVLGIVACIANIFFVTMHIITSETNMRVIS